MFIFSHEWNGLCTSIIDIDLGTFHTHSMDNIKLNDQILGRGMGEGEGLLLSKDFPRSRLLLNPYSPQWGIGPLLLVLEIN